MSEAAHGAGDGARSRIEHVTIATEIAHAPEIVFDAFSSFARYDLWAPRVQGACHWLLIQAGGVGSRFLAYDKPGRRHLTHEGVVTELERPRGQVGQPRRSDPRFRRRRGVVAKRPPLD